jgi:hypothetical protein
LALYFFYAFLAAGIINFICSILVLRGMAAAGIKVGFFEIRWQVHKHLKTYRQITLEKTGKVAWPYYGYQSSLAGMVGFIILALLSLEQ